MTVWSLAWQPGNWPAGLLLLVLRLAVLLPHRLILVIGGVMGRLAGWLMADRKLVAKSNIAACFPGLTEAQQAALVNQTLADTGRGIMEAAMALWWSDRRLRKVLDVAGLEHWQAGRSNGTLVLSAHVTMAELIVRLVNVVSDEPVTVIARRNAQPLVEAVIDSARKGYCDQVLEKKDLRGLLRRLRAGGAVLYGPDQDFTYNSVFADFFGVPAATLTVTGELAERTGCAVVPTWCNRSDNGRYQLTFHPPLDDFPSGDVVGDATMVNHWIERQVRLKPAQYLWIHRRFKTRPPGLPPFYPDRARRPKHRSET